MLIGTASIDAHRYVHTRAHRHSDIVGRSVGAGRWVGPTLTRAAGKASMKLCRAVSTVSDDKRPSFAEKSCRYLLISMNAYEYL